jgi:hypothetical protein
VVDDGSDDDTADTARAAGARVLQLHENLGIGGAVQAGYMWAVSVGAEVVLRVDGDGQHDVREARALVDLVSADEADIVIGSRFLETDTSSFRSTTMRRVGIRVFSRLVHILTRQRITDPTSGFRCVSAGAARYSAGRHPHDFPEIESLVHYHRAGFRIREVPVHMRARADGASSIRGFRSAYYTAKVLLALFVLAIEKREQ